MKLSAFEASRKRLTNYRKRNPTDSVLYRIVYEYREQFEYSFEEIFQSKYGALRTEVLEALDKYLNCGILCHGCALLECTDCKYFELLAFSCKQRNLCPSCSALRALIFSENLVDNVLKKVPHSHVVFTIPKRIRPYFKFNRKLNKYLFKAASQTIKEWCEDEHPGFSQASVMSIHTAGDLLNFNPHIHALVALGAFDKNGQFFPFEYTNTDWLSVVFARNLFDLLEKEPCIEQEVINNLKAWQNSGFNVWVGEKIEYTQTDDLKFIASYLRKSAINLQRLNFIESTQKLQVTKIYDDTTVDKHFSPLEFIAELTQHIPNKWEQTTRFYGTYSARARGAKTTNYDNSHEVEEIEEKSNPSSFFAAAMKKVFHFDPLVCPKCAGEMRIRNFLFNSKEITRMAKYTGQVSWSAPPLLSKANIA